MADKLRGRAMTAGSKSRWSGRRPPTSPGAPSAGGTTSCSAGRSRRPARPSSGGAVVDRRRPRVAAVALERGAPGICKGDPAFCNGLARGACASAATLAPCLTGFCAGFDRCCSAVAVSALVVLGRMTLDQLVGPRGWYVLLFAGVFVAARYVGMRPAIGVTLLVAVSRLVVTCGGGPGRRGGSGGDARRRAGSRRRCRGGRDVPRRGADGPATAGQRPDGRGSGGRARAPDPAGRRGAEAGPGLRDAAIRAAARRPVRRARPDRWLERTASPSSPGRPAVPALPANPATRRWAWMAGRPRRARSQRWVEEAARTGRPVRPDESLVVLPLLAGAGPLAVAAIAMPRDRPLEDEELEGLLLLGRIIGEAMARSELDAGLPPGRRPGAGGGATDRPAPGARCLARAASSTARRSPGSWWTPPRTGRHRASACSAAWTADAQSSDCSMPAATRWGSSSANTACPSTPACRPQPSPGPARRSGSMPPGGRPSSLEPATCRRWPGWARSSRCPSAGRRRSRVLVVGRSGAAGPTMTTTSASSTPSPSTRPRRSAERSSWTSCATGIAASA